MNAKANVGHDVIFVASDVARMAPTIDELSRLARHSRAGNVAVQADSPLPARSTIADVDTTFRPADAGDIPNTALHHSVGTRMARAGLVTLLLALGTGTAGALWHVYGDEAKQVVAQWTPLLATSTAVIDQTPAAERTPVQVLSQPSAEPQSADASSTTSTDEVAGMRQEIEQLKATIEELKANQKEMLRSSVNSFAAMPVTTKAGDPQAAKPAARAKTSPPRSADVPARKPLPRSSQQSAPYPASPAAPLALQPGASSTPVRAEPPLRTVSDPIPDPELSSVPRPPLPLR